MAYGYPVLSYSITFALNMNVCIWIRKGTVSNSTLNFYRPEKGCIQSKTSRNEFANCSIFKRNREQLVRSTLVLNHSIEEKVSVCVVCSSSFTICSPTIEVQSEYFY